MTQAKAALVLGATGGVGGETARRLLATGWRVRALARRPDAVPLGCEAISGDAMDARAVAHAAEGTALIVHAVNPPGYKGWADQVLPMLDNTVAAAQASGARILFPGTVYNYGPDAGDVLIEDAPQNPRTRKGAIRVEMERRLARAASVGVRTTLLRCGDFYGPRPGNNWFSQGLLRPGRPVRRVIYPGPPDRVHGWAYLPDVAETMVRLVERPEPLGDFERFHFTGHELSGRELANAIAAAVGRERLPLVRLPWPLLSLAWAFSETLREMQEVRYLWDRPVRLDNGRLIATLGEEPRTPVDVALRRTLAGLGCLPEARATQDRLTPAAF